MVKLIIQIPCFNEERTIGETIADLPRLIHGIDQIEVLVIDDGSTDNTIVEAVGAGAHYIKKLTHNQGLAKAFSAGIDTCIRLGANVVVNTDADNQYNANDIERLVAPVLRGEADLVIGDRETDSIVHFSWMKKMLQKLGSKVVRKASGTTVTDSTSGFRAMGEKAMLLSFIHNNFSYTLESIIHAGRLGLKIVNVKVQTNPRTRSSRLFKNTPDYLIKNGPVILRSYAMYRPIQIFGALAALTMVAGTGLICRFLYYYFRAPGVSSHIQSLQIGVGLLVISFVIFLLAILSDLIAANRRICEEVLIKCRTIEAELERAKPDEAKRHDLLCSKEPPWQAERLPEKS